MSDFPWTQLEFMDIRQNVVPFNILKLPFVNLRSLADFSALNKSPSLFTVSSAEPLRFETSEVETDI